MIMEGCSSCEKLKYDLSESEKNNERLKMNSSKLREKIVDTNQLIQLYLENQQAQRKMMAEIALLKEQNSILTTENESFKQEKHGPFTPTVHLDSQDTASQEMDMLKAKLSVVQNLNMQLQSEIECLSSMRLDYEKLKTEFERAKKEQNSKEAYIVSLSERLKESQSKLSLLKAQHSLPEFEGPLLSMPSLHSPIESDHETSVSNEETNVHARDAVLNVVGLFEEAKVDAEIELEPAVHASVSCANVSSVELARLKQVIVQLSEELKDVNRRKHATSNELTLELESFKQQCQSMTERKMSLEKTVSVLQVKMHRVEHDHAELVAKIKAQKAEIDTLQTNLSLRNASFQSLNAAHLKKLNLIKTKAMDLVHAQEELYHAMQSDDLAMTCSDSLDSIHFEDILPPHPCVQDDTSSSMPSPPESIASIGKHNKRHRASEETGGDTLPSSPTTDTVASQKLVRRLNSFSKSSDKYFPILLAQFTQMDILKLNSKILFGFLFNARNQKRRAHYNNLWLSFVAFWESGGHGETLFSLMHFLSSIYPTETFQLVQDVLILDLAALLKSHMFMERTKLVSLVSLYTLLARNILKSPQVSIAFLYDLWSLSGLSLSFKIYYTATVGRAWPELLSEREPRVPPLLEAIQALTVQALSRAQALDADAMSSIETLDTMCSWQLCASTTMDVASLCSHFVSQLTGRCSEPTEFSLPSRTRAQQSGGGCTISPFTFQTLSALCIICQNQGWPWTYQHLISGLVWPLFGQLGETAASSPSTKTEHQIGLLVLLLIQLSVLPLLERPSVSIKSSVAFLKSRFESILQGCVSGQYVFSIHVQSLYALAIVKYSTTGETGKSPTLARWLSQIPKQDLAFISQHVA